MIDAIIFDLGGVVVDWSPEKIFATFEGNSSLVEQIRQSPFFVDIWSEFDKGNISQAELIRQATEISGEPEAECSRFLEHIKLSLTDIPATQQLIPRLAAAGYRLFCLSNLSVEFYEYLREREVFRYFEGQVISAQEHLAKPDPAIYQLIINRYQLTPSSTLFIDDMEANIRAAQAAGVQTIHFADKEKGMQELYRKLSI